MEPQEKLMIILVKKKYTAKQNWILLYPYIPTRHLLVQSQQRKYQNNPQKLFKFKLWTDFAHFSIVSIVDFEHVNDSWTLRRIPDVKALLRLPKIKAESHG